MDYSEISVNIEKVIFCKLLLSSDFRRLFCPLLKEKYFDHPLDIIYKYIINFYETDVEDLDIAALYLEIESNENLRPENLKQIRKFIKDILQLETIKGVEHYFFDINDDYASKEIEKFAQFKAIEGAIYDSVEILETKPDNKMSISNIISDALTVGLKKGLGLNYFTDYAARFESYQNKADKMTFSIPKLNYITFGGFERKTLNCFMAGTGVGKCVSGDTQITIRNKKTGEIETINICDLNNNDHNGVFINHINNDKFLSSLYMIKAIEVLTDTGWVDIKAIHKTIPYEKWILKTNSFSLTCADTHIVFNENMEEKYIKDLKITDFVQTINGKEQIIEIVQTSEEENMYDLELIEDSNRRYYTNGILSHNTLLMTALAGDYVTKGYNVLYVTLEIAEEKIGMRVDAKLLQKTMDELREITVEELTTAFNDLEKKHHGEFIIKQYPTGSCNSLQIKTLIKELKMKYKFVPDILFVDYINLMRPTRVNKNFNSYSEVKAIAEELRGLAIEENICCITATQTNRQGINGGEVGLESVSESKALPDTVDFFCGIYQNPKQHEENIYVLNCLKNRYSGHKGKPFVLGVSKEYMNIFEMDEVEEKKVVENTDTDLEHDIILFQQPDVDTMLKTRKPKRR
jgi:replicative DNA helicase